MPLVDLHKNLAIANDQLVTRIQWDKNLITRSAAIKANLATLQAAATNSPMLFQTKNDAAAIAALQTQVQNFIVQDGGDIQSVEPMAITQEAGLDVISIALNFSLPIQNLPILLQQLETSTPYKFISNAAIQSNDMAGVNDGQGAPGQQLSINWTVDAYCPTGRSQ